MTSRPEPMAGTQSVMRAVAMLEAFTDDRPVWALGDLAAHVGLNRTTAYRLLTALESVEYVSRDPATDAYRLASGAIALGGRALRANPVRLAGRPELAALVAAFGETATLEVLSGHDVVIIEEAQGDYLTSDARHIGTRWPYYATSTGKAIAAFLPEGAQEALLSRPMRPYTGRTITSAEEMRRCLAEVRAGGFAVVVEELEPGYAAVGAPVFDFDGAVVAAVSLGGPSARLRIDRLPTLGRDVRAAAERISHKLGYRSDAGRPPGKRS